MVEHLKELYDYLVEKKYKDVVVYNLSKEDLTFDYAIVATTSSVLNNKKIANIIMQDLGIEIYPEGYNKGEWIVFDFDKIILHLFVSASREKYNLDKLWQSKKMTF